VNPYETADWCRIELMKEIIRSTMLDVGRITNLCHLVTTVPRGGAVAEFGAYKGYTACLLQSLIDDPIWIYDSFEGLPEPDKGCAINFQKGKLAATREEVESTFRMYSQRQPKIIKGWFEQLTHEHLPEKFSFVHIDADMYAGTLAVLELVYPRLAVGGIVVIDDYGWSGLPGVKAAVDKFMGNRPERVYRLQTTGDSGAAMFTKDFANGYQKPPIR
jgi:O-methyltransferase